MRGKKQGQKREVKPVKDKDHITVRKMRLFKIFSVCRYNDCE